MGTPLTIDPEFQSLLEPLADEELAQLETQIKKEGCRHPLVLWGNTLIDGHNRHAICKKHGISFRVFKKEFEKREDVLLWIIDNQMARRNINKYQRGVLALKKKDIIASKANPGKRNDLSPIWQEVRALIRANRCLKSRVCRTVR